MRPRAIAIAIAVALAGLVGCRGSAEIVEHDPYAVSESALHGALDRLTSVAADSAAAVRRTRFATRRMREAGLMPAFGDSFLKAAVPANRSVTDTGQADVLGYVAGRHPRHAGRLVLVSAQLDSPAAAAVLETARRLALEALDAQVPEKTVLFALWNPARDVATGLASYLSHPTWALDGVDFVLHVTHEVEEGGVGPVLDRYGLAYGTARVALPGEEESTPDSRAALTSFADQLHARVRSFALDADSLYRPPPPR